MNHAPHDGATSGSAPHGAALADDATGDEVLLLLDDDERFRSRMAKALRKRDLVVLEAATVASALEAITASSPTLALLDLRVGEGDGLLVLDALLRRSPQARAVMLTGYGSIATALDAMRRGAWHYLTKPTDADAALAVLDGPRGAPRHDETAADAPSLARVEWEHIQRVLTDCDGNISEAARRLGLHRRSLQRKLGKFPPRM